MKLRFYSPIYIGWKFRYTIIVSLWALVSLHLLFFSEGVRMLRASEETPIEQLISFSVCFFFFIFVPPVYICRLRAEEKTIRKKRKEKIKLKRTGRLYAFRLFESWRANKTKQLLYPDYTDLEISQVQLQAGKYYYAMIPPEVHCEQAVRRDHLDEREFLRFVHSETGAMQEFLLSNRFGVRIALPKTGRWHTFLAYQFTGLSFDEALIFIQYHDVLVD